MPSMAEQVELRRELISRTTESWLEFPAFNFPERFFLAASLFCCPA